MSPNDDKPIENLQGANFSEFVMILFLEELFK